MQCGICQKPFFLVVSGTRAKITRSVTVIWWLLVSAQCKKGKATCPKMKILDSLTFTGRGIIWRLVKSSQDSSGVVRKFHTSSHDPYNNQFADVPIIYIVGRIICTFVVLLQQVFATLVVLKKLH